MKIYEQVDKTGDLFSYSWIFDAPYKMRKELHEWTWIRGRPGSFVTNNYALAQTTAGMYKLKIDSNGTHAVHNMPMYSSPEQEYKDWLAIEDAHYEKYQRAEDERVKAIVDSPEACPYCGVRGCDFSCACL